MIRSGNRIKCRCPFHKDGRESTPSCYISTGKDGGQYFRCFGCSKSGNIITAIHLLENVSKRKVIERLSAESGIDVGKQPDAVLEPQPDEILATLCDEEEGAALVAWMGCAFMSHYQGVDDVVDKVCVIYRKLDEALYTGDKDEIRRLSLVMEKFIKSYHPHQQARQSR